MAQPNRMNSRSKEKSAALLAPDHAVLTCNADCESTEESVTTEEASATEETASIAMEGTPAAPERVIRLPWSALAPYFSEDMTDAEVEQAILDLLREHGQRREPAVPRLVALP